MDEARPTKRPNDGPTNQPTNIPSFRDVCTQPKQVRVHGTTVAECWAGAETLKTARNSGILWMDGRTDQRTDGPTQLGAESRVRD